MRRVDLTGKRIGTITVIEFAAINKDGRSCWRCRCDCGYEYIATSGTLRTAKTCKKCARKKQIEIGTRFGKLTVIRNYYDEKGRYVHECQCDCGRHRVCITKKLLSGQVKSCTRCTYNTYTRNGEEVIGYTSRGDSFRFDADMWDAVTERNWHKTAKGYIVSGKDGNRLVLHRFVVDAPSDVQVDHINRDKTDCRRINLRLASNAENCANSGTYKNNESTGHKNVYIQDGRYKVVIRKDGLARHFGYYATLDEAIAVANKRRKELFGEFAYYDVLTGEAKAVMTNENCICGS